MRRSLLFILLVITPLFLGFAQEEADGVWFLENFTLGGEEIELGSFPTAIFRVSTGNDDEGSITGRDFSCINYSADIVVTEDTFILSDVSLFDDLCTSSVEIEFKNIYYDFLFGDLNIPLNFVVSGVDAEAQLVVTNENGDQATFVTTDPLIPNAFVQEPWYVSQMEIDGEILNYPPYEEIRVGLHIVTDFTFNSGISIHFTCQAGGFAGFGTYQEGANQKIEITGLGLLTLNCGTSLALDFDNTFLNLIEQKPHTYEIIEEGQGRRLTLTDDNGNKIYYTNAFLAPRDSMLDGTWYFDSLLIEDILVESPENAIPYLRIDSETELWQGKAACNTYDAHYSTIQNTLTLQNYDATEVACNTEEQTDFEDFYLNQFMGVDQELNEFDYDVNEDTEGYRTLTLTDLSTGAIAMYTTKHPFIPSALEESWTLTSLENDGTSIEIPESALSTFTVTIQPENSLYFLTDNCAQYGGEMSITDSEMIVNQYNEALDACMEEDTQPQELGDAITNFYSMPSNQTLTYEISNEANIATRQLTITKENGDQAVYGVNFSETLVALTSEPWYLDFYEIDGLTFDYPPQEDQQFARFIITSFDTQGEIQQQLTCWNPTSSSFEVIDNQDHLQILIGNLSVVTPNCGASAPFYFDIRFLNEFRNSAQTIEIIEEGQGRTLTLTNENGNRIFYTNAFLSTEDIGASPAITISPNPAADVLFINSTVPLEPLKMMIFNLQGQRVVETDFKSQIDVSDLAQGLYFIKFKGETQESVHRFIKQ